MNVHISIVEIKAKIYLYFHFHFHPSWLTMLWNAPNIELAEHEQ